MNALFETERLRVRGIEERDAEKLLELINDPDWLRYVGDRGVRTVEQAIPYIRERMLGKPGAEHYGLYVVERKSDGAWLGNTSFFKRQKIIHDGEHGLLDFTGITCPADENEPLAEIYQNEGFGVCAIDLRNGMKLRS